MTSFSLSNRPHLLLPLSLNDLSPSVQYDFSFFETTSLLVEAPSFSRILSATGTTPTVFARTQASLRYPLASIRCSFRSPECLLFYDMERPGATSLPAYNVSKQSRSTSSSSVLPLNWEEHSGTTPISLSYSIGDDLQWRFRTGEWSVVSNSPTNSFMRLPPAKTKGSVLCSHAPYTLFQNGGILTMHKGFNSSLWTRLIRDLPYNIHGAFMAGNCVVLPHTLRPCSPTGTCATVAYAYCLLLLLLLLLMTYSSFSFPGLILTPACADAQLVTTAAAAVPVLICFCMLPPLLLL